MKSLDDFFLIGNVVGSRTKEPQIVASYRLSSDKA
jgi:hypothetical protein